MRIATILEMAAALEAGRTTSAEATETALARANDSAGEGALVFTQLYAEAALAQAAACDALFQCCV